MHLRRRVRPKALVLSLTTDEYPRDQLESNGSDLEIPAVQTPLPGTLATHLPSTAKRSAPICAWVRPTFLRSGTLIATASSPMIQLTTLTLEGALIFESNGDFVDEESHTFCVGCGDDQAAIGESRRRSALSTNTSNLPAGCGTCSYCCVANKCVAEVESRAAMQRCRYFNDLNINGFDAFNFCNQSDMSLLTINSAEESQLVNLITGCEDDVNVWIGWNKYSPWNVIYQRDGGTGRRWMAYSKRYPSPSGILASPMTRIRTVQRLPPGRVRWDGLLQVAGALQKAVGAGVAGTGESAPSFLDSFALFRLDVRGTWVDLADCFGQASVQRFTAAVADAVARAKPALLNGLREVAPSRAPHLVVSRPSRFSHFMRFC